MSYGRAVPPHTAMAGHMDLERGKPMREDAIFRIYSMSKPITSVALMMLVEEGLIGLDGALPTTVERPMKVIDLCTHTSGLTYGFMMRTSVDAAYRKAKVNDFQTEGGLEGMMEQLSHIPLEFSPGTAWNYSVSIDVMGYLVQKLSGLSFGEFLRTRLFEPLGLEDSAFFVAPENINRFTSCYQPKEGGGIKLQDDARESTSARPPLLEAGGGGL